MKKTNWKLLSCLTFLRHLLFCIYIKRLLFSISSSKAREQRQRQKGSSSGPSIIRGLVAELSTQVLKTFLVTIHKAHFISSFIGLFAPSKKCLFPACLSQKIAGVPYHFSQRHKIMSEIGPANPSKTCLIRILISRY